MLSFLKTPNVHLIKVTSDYLMQKKRIQDEHKQLKIVAGKSILSEFNKIDYEISATIPNGPTAFAIQLTTKAQREELSKVAPNIVQEIIKLKKQEAEIDETDNERSARLSQ